MKALTCSWCCKCLEADDLQKTGVLDRSLEKLNALGIYKFSQLANMTPEIEEEVNVAIIAQKSQA